MGRFSYNDLTLLKIIAVVAMIIDHYNKFLNAGQNQIMFGIGRIALPIFLFVLAYNLANIKPEKMPTIFKRLVVFGCMAMLPYNAMGGGILWGWWPLNVLYLLAGLVAVAYLLKVPVASLWQAHLCKLGAVLAWFAFGLTAEFWWFGLNLGIFLFWLFSLGENDPKWKKWLVGAGAAACLVSLGFVNGNQWALASIPVIALVLSLPVGQLPRGKWFFYWFYPAHLAALWVAKIYM